MISKNHYAIVTDDRETNVSIYDNYDKKVIRNIHLGDRLIGLGNFSQILNGCVIVKEDNKTSLYNMETSKQVTLS